MFQRLNITDAVLDRLGFSEYWDEHGTWGGRTLTFSDGTRFRIIEREEQDADYYQNANQYIAKHFYFAGWFAIPKINSSGSAFDLFFIHEMYECIKKFYPQCLDEFVSKCDTLGMEIYIKEYLEYIDNSQKSNNHPLI